MNMPSTKKHTCAEIPQFERLNYFYGQMLSAADFRSEQAYLREKLKLHNRCLHGYGVICGLEVTPVPVHVHCPPEHKEEIEKIKARLTQLQTEIGKVQDQLQSKELKDTERDALQAALDKLNAERESLRRRWEELCCDEHDPKDPCAEQPEHSIKVAVQCGLALDCCGNELVLRAPMAIDLWTALKPSERDRLKEAQRGALYLSICYCAEPIHPSRPVVPDTCGSLADCNYGKLRDSVRFRVTLDPPATDERCEPCCSACTDECLLLARVCWEGNPAIDEDDIDNSVRRPISLYPPTVITGISWKHGATYGPAAARDVLGTESDMGGRTDGLEITFSRPVYAETLTPGVVDLWRIQGGRGLRGVISSIEGEYVGKPDEGLITSFKYRDASGETLNDGDRVLIIIRADFILDACCRPVDGNHVGGRVPQLAAYQAKAAEAKYAAPGMQKTKPDDGNCDGPCRVPPGGIGPWTSGNGTAGGSFESWFYVD
ncbi:MAG TPA: ABC transporter C-terminal domain-containing protein [Candidatus Cybelea sp.]|nr:ABC transporter C-terminal domain-containing protein [Candidatus Cybelea sp.]